ncbi:type III-A CRISPR-associated RAMP protein Csm5 [Brachyspira pulli]|uniref:type III-A CRISPR-associated RAMP protein Csm5 n=1 Tax=Brachyspira pulli TaxID=310721 RepID=UPI003003C754
MEQIDKIKNYKVYKMSLTTLSPIFIGSGDTLNKSSYFYSDKEVNVIDEKKLIKLLYTRRGLFETFMSEASSGNLNLTNFLESNIPTYKKLDIAKYKLMSHSNIITTKGKLKTLNEINAFIKSSNGNPYIPGSSIKGFIRTALIASEIRRNKDRYTNFFNSKKTVKDLQGLEDMALSNIFKEVLDKSNFKFSEKDYNEFKNKPNLLFKFLIVSDSDEVSLDKLFVGKQYDFTTKSNTVRDLPIFMEFIRPLTTFNFTITMDKSIVDYFDMSLMLKRLTAYYSQYFNSIKAMCALCLKDYDDKYAPYIDDEKDKFPPNSFLGGHDGYFTKNILYSLCKFKDDGIEKEKIINLLKAHFFAKHNHDKYDTIISPRTMKLTMYNNKLYNIGICSIRTEEELC